MKSVSQPIEMIPPNKNMTAPARDSLRPALPCPALPHRARRSLALSFRSAPRHMDFRRSPTERCDSPSTNCLNGRPGSSAGRAAYASPNDPTTRRPPPLSGTIGWTARTAPFGLPPTEPAVPFPNAPMRLTPIRGRDLPDLPPHRAPAASSFVRLPTREMSARTPNTPCTPTLPRPARQATRRWSPCVAPASSAQRARCERARCGGCTRC